MSIHHNPTNPNHSPTRRSKKLSRVLTTALLAGVVGATAIAVPVNAHSKPADQIGAHTLRGADADEVTGVRWTGIGSNGVRWT